MRFVPASVNPTMVCAIIWAQVLSRLPQARVAEQLEAVSFEKWLIHLMMSTAQFASSKPGAAQSMAESMMSFTADTTSFTADTTVTAQVLGSPVIGTGGC